MLETKDAKQTLLTVRDWCRYGASCFEAAGLFYGHSTDNAWDEAVALILHGLKLDHEFGLKIIDCRLTTFEKNEIIKLFNERMVKRLPTPYITNKAHYAGFDFFVDQRVLIPRSPIVELIEKEFQPWIDAEKVSAILDIGTGSGCLAIIVAHYFPEASIEAVDIDPNALAVARRNVEYYKLEEQVSLIESDLFSALGNKTYDIILTNPPYVDAEDMVNLPAEYHHEPIRALASGIAGLDHMQQILKDAKKHLNPDGILIGEVGNSAAALELHYPEINFTWLEFERGGNGVFLLNYDQLDQHI